MLRATDDGFSMSDGETSRPVLDRLGRCFSVPNRWPVLPGPAEVLIGAEHATSFEALPAKDAGDMLLLLDRRYRALAQEFPSVAAFLNVGAGSGASLPHVHAQVVATASPPSEGLARCTARVGVSRDIELAREEGLVVVEDGRGVAWVAPAPSTSVELRVSSPSSHDAASLTVEVVGMIGSRVRWPYALVWHGGDRPFVRWLSRIDAGRIYPDFFGRTIAQDPSAFASVLRGPVVSAPV